LDCKAVNTAEQDRIDQALFGYSEGHRQIAASVRLPSADLYRLSAASDLATGTKLAPDESYITGIPLEESKRYALIRTWLAPELPRPGCVWSHVLLLDARVLGTRTDLHDLLKCFKRPHGDFKAYGVPTPLEADQTEPPAIDEPELHRAIEDYYSGQPVLLSEALDRKMAEGIVMAMWSQQWPRLRATFAFRTARTERRKSDILYDVQLNSLSDARRPTGTIGDWALVGARDAATCQVTDLRRFLWRYGRDISAARSSYRILVELFLLGHGHQNIPTEHALQVFRALPDPNDGEILKKDILGIPAASPSLTPPISPIGLLEVLANQKAHQLFPQGIVARRFQGLDRAGVTAVARYFDLHYDALSPWKDALENAIVTSADASTLSQDFPQRFRMEVLRARPDLVSPDTVPQLSNNELADLLDIYPATSAEDALALEAVRRDFGAAKNNELVRKDPRRFFGAALDAIAIGEINSAWKGLWPVHAGAIFSGGWPRAERSWSRVALGVSYLGYPRRVGPRAEEWAAILACITDDLQGDDRVRLQGYLLRSALDEGSAGTWKLCAIVLPELRPVVLRGALPDDVYRMLSSDLPMFNTAGYWDINRRVLICLSYLRRKVSDAYAESALGLSDHDLQVLFNGASDEEDSKRSRFWWF
jgi:GTPase-associated protein 1